jgi:hypothetical protein
MRTASGDVDYFPWPDGGHGLPDSFSNGLVISDAISGNMNDHDSKLEQRKVVLMFKPAVDRQKSLATFLQTLHQDGSRSPPHPNSCTVKTTCSASRSRLTRGFTHSSRTIRTGVTGGDRLQQSFLGQGEKACGLFALHTRKVGEKGIDGVALLYVIEKGLNRYTRTAEAGGTMHNVSIHQDDLIDAQLLLRSHIEARIRQNANFLQDFAAWREQ